MANVNEPDSGMDRYLPELSRSGARWARFFGILVAAALLAWLVFVLRDVFTPIAVALALAYILNPLVTWLERYRISRVTSIAGIYILGTAVVAALLLMLALKAVDQLIEFNQSVPGYVEQLRALFPNVFAELMPATQPAATLPATTALATDGRFAADLTATGESQLGLSGSIAALLSKYGIGTTQTVVSGIVGYVFGFVSNATYFISITILVPMYTFFFLWKFEPIVRAVRDHLPARYRPVIVRVVTTIDRATAEFFRGRLIICLIVGVITAIGWALVGVRYSVVLGMAVGVLNLVPLLPAIILVPALIFAYLPAVEAGQSWMGPVIFTMGVFLFGQAVENFLLSPWISGKSVGLHPITTVVALLIGGQLAGLLGMLLSIPIASTLKSLAMEFVMPEIRRLADERAESGPVPPPRSKPARKKR